MKIKFFAAALLLLLTALPASSKTSIVIIYTNSLNGNLDFCHCKADPKGGLVKRSTEMKKLRALHRETAAFETGDFFPAEFDPLLSEYIAKSYAHIGYDAILPGDHEFMPGENFIAAYNKSLPLICGNISKADKNASNLFPASKIIRRAEITIGIAATISPDVFLFVDKKISSKIKIKNQAETLKADIAVLRAQGAQMIIVLSHSGYEADMALAQYIKGIDLIIGGHSQTLLKQPVKSGSTIIVQAGTNGSRIGVLEIEFSGGKISSYRNSFRLPDENQPADDPVIRGYIREYEKRLLDKYKDMRFN